MQMLPPFTDQQRRLIFFALVALLLALALIQHAGRMTSIGFTTHDDMHLEFFAQDVKSSGFPAYWRLAAPMAAEQGRVSYHVGLIFFLAPYFTDSDLARALLATAVQCLSIGALAAFLALYVEPAAVTLFLTLFYALLPHWWACFPIAAYPVFYHVPVLLFFAAMTTHVAGSRGRAEFRKPWIRAVCYLAMTWSLLLYEAPSVIFAGVMLGVVLWEGNGRGGGGFAQKVRDGVRRHASVVFVLVFASLVYLVFRAVHPPTYQGTAIDGNALANWQSIWAVVWIFATRSLPVANFFGQPEFFAPFSDGSIQGDGVLHFIFNNLGGAGLFISLLAAIGAGFLGWNISSFATRNQKSTDSAAKGRWAWFAHPLAPLAVVAVLGFLAAFIVQVPLGLSPKYQADPKGWAPYIAGYYSYIGFTIALVFSLMLGFRWTAQQGPAMHRAFVVLSGFACLTLAIMNSVASDAVIRSQQEHYAKWRLVKLAGASGHFLTLPGGSLVVAPSLWGGINPAWSGAKTYWTEYFGRHFGVQLTVVSEWPPLGSRQTAVYYCTFNRGASPEDAALLFSAVNWCDQGACGNRQTNGFTLFSRSELKAKDVLVVAPDGQTGGDMYISTAVEPKGIQRAIPIAQSKSVPGGFRAVVETGAVRADSAGVVPHRDPLGATPALGVAFQSGFGEQERAGSNLLRWSDGPSGTGVLALANHAAVPVLAEFAAQILTQRDGKIPCRLTSGDRTETFSAAHQDRIARTLTLPPGNTELVFHCDAGRLTLPNDSRYIVFGLQNWSLTDAGTAQLLRGSSREGSENMLGLNFLNGFSVAERDVNSYWRWSDGPDGSGTIELFNQTERPLKALFRAEFVTGYREKSTLEMTYGAKKETLSINNQRRPFTTELVVPPGKSQMVLKSDGKRAPAPGDPRYLVFAIHNWSVVSLERAERDRK